MAKPIIAPTLPELSRIDFPAIIARLGDLRDLVSRDLNDPGHRGKFTCPFHAGGQERTPSLSVRHDGFKCFGCGESGDALDWYAVRRNLTKVQAAKEIDPTIVTAEDLKRLREAAITGEPAPRIEDVTPTAPFEPPPPRAPDPEIWRDAKWQAQLSEMVQTAERILWSPAGLPALGWLRGRGLTDTTIRRFRLGFLDAPHSARPIPHWLDEAGRPRRIWAVRGITIPWLAPGAWYSEADGEPDGPRWVGMNVRKLSQSVEAELPEDVEKCQAVAGSKRGRLYPWPSIERTQSALPLLLVEGEFDALVGVQEVGHVLNVGTVGGASTSVRNLPAETRAAIARCPWLLLALDMDGPGAVAARKWREAYPDKSRRVLLPFGKDLNDYFRKGGDVLAWLAEVRHKLARPLSQESCP